MLCIFKLCVDKQRLACEIDLYKVCRICNGKFNRPTRWWTKQERKSRLQQQESNAKYF
jgi:hypothetical protein